MSDQIAFERVSVKNLRNRFENSIANKVVLGQKEISTQPKIPPVLDINEKKIVEKNEPFEQTTVANEEVNNEESQVQTDRGENKKSVQQAGEIQIISGFKAGNVEQEGKKFEPEIKIIEKYEEVKPEENTNEKENEPALVKEGSLEKDEDDKEVDENDSGFDIKDFEVHNEESIEKPEEETIQKTEMQDDEKYYENLFKNLKYHKVQLVDDSIKSSSSSSKRKGVKFGNSWKGTLESSSSNRPLAQNIFHKDNGKLIIQLMNLRGIVLNHGKTPDETSFYICLKANHHAPMYTEPVQNCMENLFTALPIYQTFGFGLAEDEEVELELYVKSFYYEKKKHHRLFFEKQKLPEPERIEKVIEEKICSIQFQINQLNPSCHESVLEQKWSWHVFKNEFRPPSLRPGSRASSIFKEAGAFFSKFRSRSAYELFRRPSSSSSQMTTQPESKKDWLQVNEAGSLQAQLIYVPNLTEEEIQALPNDLDQGLTYLKTRIWENKIWMEGFLSQEGGDVKFWHRRYYQLKGGKLFAFREFTNEFSTTIDLSQMQKLEKLKIETDTEHFPTIFSFRLYFKHGETIDFHADDEHAYEQWISSFEEMLQEKPRESLNMNYANRQRSENEEKPAVKPIIKKNTFKQTLRQFTPMKFASNRNFVGVFGTRKSKDKQ